VKPAVRGRPRSAVSVAGIVRVTATIQSAFSTLEIHTFWPLMRKSSPAGRAWVVIAIALDPASGSVSARQNCTDPSARPGRIRCFCSSVPWRVRVMAPKPGVVT
jgi:hypothetical protein